MKLATIALALGVAVLLAGPAAADAGTVDNPHVALDGSGNAVAVWQSDGLVQAGVRPAGGSWGARQDISARVGATDPQVALDPAGDAVVVWVRSDGSNSRVQAATRAAGGPWGPPQDLFAVGQFGGGPQVALDAGGNAVVVWVRSDGSSPSVQATVRPAGGTWATPQDLSAAGLHAYAPDLGVNAAGDAVVVWESSDSQNGSRAVVQGAVRPAGGMWSPPEDISVGDSSDPQVALDSAGNAIAAWEDFPGGGSPVEAAVRPAGGAWGDPEVVSAQDDLAIRPRIALDSAGNAVALWTRLELSGWSVRAAARLSGGSWGAPQDLSASGEFAFLPELALNPAGDAVAVWSRFAESSEVVQAATRSAGGTWERALDISPFPGSSYVPQVAIDSSGNTVGVWRLHTGSLAIVQAAVHPAGLPWEPLQDLTEPPPLPPLPDCIVPDVLRKTLVRARTVIEESNCLLGRVRRAYSRKVKNGRVVSQRPGAGEELGNGALVDLVVSRGRRSARS
ncbi:MAG TPA: PASTA domain-containing protein [Gaiellaceae bacterium]|nr:PASTA domain-containing protein [Gaiellaceae bacterium]